MKRTELVGILVAVGVSAYAPSALADALDATLGGPLTETSHGVRLTLEDGIASYRVRRTFANRSDQHDEAVLTIRLPAYAAATGLRIRAGETWHDGELMDADRAAELYQELTGLGPHKPKDPALLRWLWSDRLEMYLFPVPPHSTATVEYTLTAPTEYRDGVTVVSYPVKQEEGGDLTDPVLTVAAGAGPVIVDDLPVASEQPVLLRAKPRDPRCDELGLAAGCVVSAVRVPSILGSTATVRANIRHTYASDLRVVLGTPDGRHIDLWKNQGGGDNDVSIERVVRCWNVPEGEWLVGVSDDVGLDVGALLSFEVTTANAARHAADDLPLHIPDAGAEGGLAKIEIGTNPDAVAARFSHVGLKNAHVSRLEVDVPRQLSRLPVAPHVVAVIDASRSVRAGGLETQRQLLKGFLAHVPDARVEIVAARRHASRVFGEFLPAADVGRGWKDAVSVSELDLGNGSNLDRAFELADSLVRGLEGPRYIISFTDDRLRPSWPSKPAVTSATDDLVSHVIVLDGSSDGLERDDGHRLATFATTHGGILVHENMSRLDDKRFARETLHLVRPTRLEMVTYDGFDELPTVLWEGESFRQMVSSEVRKGRLRGQLWSRNISIRPRTSTLFDRATAAWTFSHDIFEELDEDQQLAFAMFGRAVSPVTSYLAIEPGVRPSRAGIERGVGGLGMRGVGFGGGGASLGMGWVRPDLTPLFRDATYACRQAHPGQSVSIDVHTTLEEIVQIDAQTTSPYATCVVEAAWTVMLPVTFGRLGESTLHFTL